MKNFKTFFCLQFERGVLCALLCFLLISCARQEIAETTRKASNNSALNNSAADERKKESVQANKSNKLDACEMLPKSEIAEITAQPVRSAELSRAVEGTESTAAFSTCTYQLSSGESVQLFARRSPVPDNTPEAYQKLRETMNGFGRLEDVSELGAQAFWLGKMKQLHVLSGENIYVFVTMMNFKNETEAKSKAIEIAHRATANLSK